MKLKHLQLNTKTLESPELIVKFIIDNAIDVACLQEVAYSIGGISPLKHLLEDAGYYYCEAIKYHYTPKNLTVANAIASRFPITDSIIQYVNSSEFEPKVLEGANLINAGSAAHMPGSRGIAHAAKSFNLLSTLIETPEGIIRVLTTHFPVSDSCTETEMMLQMAKIIRSHVRYASAKPTIFSGDLNIRPQSYSVLTLSKEMVCHTKDLTDTLASDHPAKLNDAPDGYAIDHVFSKDVNHIDTHLVEVSFSDHKAVISEFQL